MESGIYHCSPTNSTFFTDCCDVAITDVEPLCPKCRNDVVGHDENSPHLRGQVRRIACKK